MLTRIFPGPYTDAQKIFIAQEAARYLGVSLDTPADAGFVEVMIETMEAGEVATFEQAFEMLRAALAGHSEDEDI